MKKQLKPALLPALIALFALSLPPAALAQAASDPASTASQPAPAAEQAEMPEVDNTAADQAPLLTGGVHKSDWTPEQHAEYLRARALKKLQSHQPLTAADFRDLGVGVIGMDTVRPYMKNEARVERIYAGCPAAVAGIKLGDIIMDSDEEDAKVEDPSIPRWAFSCGLAGQTRDVTVHRHGRDLTFHLVEMNMEDIPDLKYRHLLEQLVQETGAPAENVPIPEPEGYSAPKASATTSTAKFIFGLLGL